MLDKFIQFGERITEENNRIRERNKAEFENPALRKERYDRAEQNIKKNIKKWLVRFEEAAIYKYMRGRKHGKTFSDRF